MKLNHLFLMLCCLSLIQNIQGQNDLFQKNSFILGSDTLNYRILYPKDFSETKSYPVVLFLHGAGERGNDNMKQLTHGSRLFADPMNRGAFPAIVIFPQCGQETYWSNADVDRSSYPISLKFPKDSQPTTAMHLVLNFMDDFVTKPYVNQQKVYVGGLSMGGMGTFEILSRRPNMFAAAIAICGGGNTELAENYAAKVPMWIFHGAKDDVVNPQLSIDMVSAILKYGGKPNFSLYAKDNHNSWDSTFAEPQLLTWLFSHSK